jgi:hypothetical protein
MRKSSRETFEQHESSCPLCIKGLYFCPTGTRLNKKIDEKHAAIGNNSKVQKPAETSAQYS